MNNVDYFFFCFIGDHKALDKVAGLENGLSISTKNSTAEDSGVIDAVLVNTNEVTHIVLVVFIDFLSYIWLHNCFPDLNMICARYRKMSFTL